MMMKPNDAKMMMPRTRKNTRSINSLAEARNVCSRIFNPDEWRVSLNSLRILMIEKNSKTSAFLMWETCCWRKRSV